jgi:uroporphyrinogen decarboxylase
MVESALSPRARMLIALKGGQPDRVPIFDWVNNQALYTNTLGETPTYYDGALAVRCARALGLDAAWVPAEGFMALPSPRWNWLDNQRYIDEWGTVYQVGEGSWPLAFPQTHPVQTEADWAASPRPVASESWRTCYADAAVAEAHQGKDDDLAVIAGIRGPFSSAWMLMGLEQMSFALADRPDLLTDIFEVTGRFWTEVGLDLIAHGVDALVVHDDQGSGTSTFFSPARFRKYVLPFLQQQIRTLAKTGTPIILHSCGNIKLILPDLVSTGISALNNVQRSAGMDLAGVKAEYGTQLGLIGNVDASRVMPYATPQEVEEAVRVCIREGAGGGGYVLATDHSFHEGISYENVQAFVAAGHKFGSYDK